MSLNFCKKRKPAQKNKITGKLQTPYKKIETKQVQISHDVKKIMFAKCGRNESFKSMSLKAHYKTSNSRRGFNINPSLNK